MKASRFTQAQKAFILTQGMQGPRAAEICREAGTSQTPYLDRRKTSAGLMPSETRRLRAIEDDRCIGH